MIKNMLSKALLSVVMDKSARDTLEFKKKIREAGQTLAEEKAAARLPDQPADPSETQNPPAAPPAQTEPRDPISGLNHEETRQLIVDSLKAAEDELGAKPEMTGERQALIRQAMEIRDSKQHVLDDISEEQRQKLTFLALQALKGDPASIAAPNRQKKKKQDQ
ncbi:MAG: hypothetical protein ISR51_04735 [Rhodospirillales bacterium]|nr:hypothetical protein [Rhodospirillales bacterium]